jgi:uncharacterized protein (TIGR04255 family)
MKKESKFNFDVEESFPHLPAAPIVEAVIHWVARRQNPLPQAEWRDQLTKLLPDYPECQPQHELRLEAEIAPEGSSTEVRRDIWRGFRLTSSDKRQIVQFNHDGMVFSRLKPYEDWNVFSAEGLRLWTLFVQLAEPSEVQRLGVRFINRIAPIDPTKLGKYLAKPPKCLEPLGLPMTTFLYQSTHDVPGHPFKVNVVQAIQPPSPPQAEGFGLILDIDVFTTQAFQPSDEILNAHLTRMRWLKDKAFFSLLKENAIKIFKGNKE